MACLPVTRAAWCADSPEIDIATDTGFFSSDTVTAPVAPAVSKCNNASADPLPMTTTEYDTMKVDHVLEVIRKLDSKGPTIFGMNFQVR
jgi:hypothetical protein